ncbi:MAG TPA: hypothetical protein VLZ12_13395 [Verrucomicrobiae bacterium]|nr:hypothetical protein [Verrucomicrobiae bacterium]
MVGQTRLNELRARKELLLLQADAQRRLIALEAVNAARALRWVESVHRAWQHVKPWAWLVAPVAGFCATRHTRPLWRGVLYLVRTGRWINRILRV